MKPTKWLQKHRLYMASILKYEFGPISNWENSFSPIKNDRTQRFRNVLEKIRLKINSELPADHQIKKISALIQQLQWATTKQATITKECGMPTFILMTAACLETGLMKYTDLPNLILKEH